MEEYLALHKGVIYGPVISRRLGRSLGINILSPYRKICSFDCSYCQYGPTKMHSLQPPSEAFPTTQEILIEIEKALVIHKHLDHLTFSGNGEPTLHPEFGVIAKEVHRLRDQYRPEVQIALFTNSTTLEGEEILRGIRDIDLPIFKLDVGDREMFNKVDHPVGGVDLERMIDQLALVKGLTIQSLFLAGEMEDSNDFHFQMWLRAIEKIQPKIIQLSSCDWSFPTKGVEKIPKFKLMRIAEIIHEKTRRQIEVY